MKVIKTTTRAVYLFDGSCIRIDLRNRHQLTEREQKAIIKAVNEIIGKGKGE